MLFLQPVKNPAPKTVVLRNFRRVIFFPIGFIYYLLNQKHDAAKLKHIFYLQMVYSRNVKYLHNYINFAASLNNEQWFKKTPKQQ